MQNSKFGKKNKLVFLFTLAIIISACDLYPVPKDEDGITSDEHRVFVTSTAYDGKLGDKSPDEICDMAADAAHLKNDYKAIISTGSGSAKARITTKNGPIYKISGASKTKVAETIDALWAGSGISSAIDIDELGQTVGAADVWTGTATNGDADTATNALCLNWTNNAVSNVTKKGIIGATNTDWLSSGTNKTCDTGGGHIYCISQ